MWVKTNMRRKLIRNEKGVPVLTYSAFISKETRSRFFTMKAEEEFFERLSAVAGKLRGEWSRADVVRLGLALVERAVERGEQVPELSMYVEGGKVE